MDILFEDSHLLAVNKPAGLITQPSLEHPHSLEEQCKQYIKTAYNKPGNVFLHAVHRLDRVVSGIVLFAKTSKALSRLQEALRDGRFEKTYVALVEGVLVVPQGVLEHYLVHGDGKAYVCKKNGKRCQLSYETTRIVDGGSVVTIQLHTGRYHQIRAQFAAIGHPIKGDVKYGSVSRGLSSIALHHASLVFPHPISKEKISLIAPFASPFV